MQAQKLLIQELQRQLRIEYGVKNKGKRKRLAKNTLKQLSKGVPK